MLRSGIHLGRLFGIRITLDLSLIVIFVLVWFSLGAGAFPAWHPDWSPLLTWGLAAAAAVLFFLSILVHELSHALVAKAYGIPVERITLFIFGGVANIEEDPASPLHEAVMAGIGPVTSVGIGIACSFLAMLLSPTALPEDPMLALQQMSPLVTLLAWLGPINILVGLFNLLPGFPLDGGRVLRALIWGISKDLKLATRWASRMGQAFGFALIALGAAMAFGVVVPVLGGGLMQGIWLAFIGWFLNNAARLSYRQHLVREMLEDVPVWRLMRRESAPGVLANEPISTLVHQHLIARQQQAVVVYEGDRVAGIVEARDVRAIPRSEWETRPVSDVVRDLGTLPVLDPNLDMWRALRSFGRSKMALLPVRSQGQIVGMLHQADVARFIDLQVNELGRPGHGLPRET